MTPAQGIRAISLMVLCTLISSCVIAYGPYFKNETDKVAHISFVATRADTLIDWPAWELLAGNSFISLMADPRNPMEILSLTIRYGDEDSIAFNQSQLEDLFSEVGGAVNAAFIISVDGVSVISEEEMLASDRKNRK